MADAELDWKLPHGGLYGFPSPAGIFAAFSMPGENRYRIFGNFPPGPEGPSAEYSEPTHEEFQAMVNERVPFPAKVVKEYWVTRYRVHSRTVPRYRDGTGIPRRRRRPRAQSRGRTRHEHRHPGRLQPGVETRPRRTRASPTSRYWTAIRPSATRWVFELLKTTDRLFSVFGGQNPLARLARGRVAPRDCRPCADPTVGPQAVHRPAGATAPSLPGQPAERRGRFGLARRARTRRPGPRGRRDHRRAAGTPLRRVPRHPSHRAAVHRTRRRRAPGRGTVPDRRTDRADVSRDGESARGQRRAIRRSPCGTWRSDAVGTSPVRDQHRPAHSSCGPTSTSATAAAPSTSTG